MYNRETQRFICKSCNREFAITLEPDTPSDPNDGEDSDPVTCPWCGRDGIEEVAMNETMEA